MACFAHQSLILLAADGLHNQQIGFELGESARMVASWLGRFLLLGIQDLPKDAPRSERTPIITAETVAEGVAGSRERDRPMLPSGPREQWLAQPVSRRPAWGVSGMHAGSNLIASKASRSAAILSSPPSWTISSASV